MTTDSPNSRNIPLPIQREVRQRCGFGCVLCGLPLYEYEHMEGWANVQRHVAQEITLLCKKHHSERTTGLLPLADVRTANADPINLRTGVSHPYDLHFSGQTAEVNVGGNVFKTNGDLLVPICIDGIPLIFFRRVEGRLFLNATIFDETNQALLKIQDNQLLYVPETWDIELIGRKLVMRETARQILLEIQFEPPDRIIIPRARLLCNGVEIIVRPDYLLVTNTGLLLNGCTSEGASGGLFIGYGNPAIPCIMSVKPMPRYVGDRSEAIKWAKEQMELSREVQSLDSL